MKRLTRERFRAAQSYVLEQARPLDQQRFRYHFANGAAADVLAELNNFQNPDGGFGHALESDMRAPASSAIATAQGFAILAREIGAAGSEPAVQRAIRYLVEHYDPGRGVWPIVTAAVEEAPHAPWWSYADSEQNFGGWRINPTASIAGYLYDYPELAPEALLADVINCLLERLEAAPETMEMHDLQCYLGLAAAKHLPAAVRSQVQRRLRQIAPKSIERDPAQWGGYGLLPLDVAPVPGSFLTDVIDPGLVEANLDLVLDQQLPDGSWPVAWNWSFVDEQAWAQAERDWKGQIAVNKLLVLRAYERTEGM